MSHSHFLPLSVSHSSNRSTTLAQTTLRTLLQVLTQPHTNSTSEFFLQVEQATTAQYLNRAVNCIQERLWELPAEEQALPRKRLVVALSSHVLHAADRALRLEAASWLRTLMQAGLIQQPEEIFVTLVTAAVQTSTHTYRNNAQELASYLTMIFDCFWPFRYPYAVFTWEKFPTNDVFYPLAPLISRTEAKIQELLFIIFAEIPTLDDPEIVEYLLPVALTWSSHADPERRRRVTNVLARMNRASAQEALYRLERDSNPLVRASAQRAAAYVQGA